MRGTAGQAALRGNDFRRLVGYDVLKSTLFAVAVDGVLARFAGRGYGHGVGHGPGGGAHHGAARATTREQILAYYYPGASFGAIR